MWALMRFLLCVGFGVGAYYENWSVMVAFFFWYWFHSEGVAVIADRTGELQRRVTALEG